MVRLLCCGFWSVALVLLVGCGSSTGTLSGIVTYKGQTLSGGSVQVVGSDGLAKVGMIREDGNYTVEDIQTGVVQIAVFSPDPANSQGPKGGKLSAHSSTSTGRKGWVPIPEHYGDFLKSGLTHQLQNGSNTKDLELK
jgi:hypothetical protein